MHNVDERDAFAWAPAAVPAHRLRASALLAACAALHKQDSAPAAAAVTPRAAAAAAVGVGEAPRSPFAAGAEGGAAMQPPAAAEQLPQQGLATPPASPAATPDEGFLTPKGQQLKLGFIDFPTPADTSALSTPTLLTPACTPPLAACGRWASLPDQAAAKEGGREAAAPARADSCHMLGRSLGGRVLKEF